ncbi:MAG: PAS domain S-box protein [Candidatus Marinimicrobia bacterium]|nr:PAS domain S-box protein [Candidatus Neomarinimicrobiota bacterium]
MNLQRILDSIEEKIIYLDRNRRIMYANEAACDSAGKSLSNIVGRYCYDIWGDSASGICESCPLEEVFDKGRSCSSIATSRDGRGWYVKGYPVIGDNGELLGAVEIVESVTKLVESEEKYKLLVENINDGVVISQANKVLYSNRRFAELLGHEHDEMEGFDLKKVYTSEGIKILIDRHVKRCKKEYIPSRYETTFKRKDGNIIPVEVDVRIIEYRGKPATFAIVRDISSRKEVERRVREVYNITENASVAIATFDKNFTVTYVNKFFTKLYGYKAEEIIGKPIYLLCGEKNPEEYFTRIVKRMKGNRIYRGHDLRRKRDGKVFWASVSTSRIVDENGNFLFFADNSRDITSEKAALDRLKESEERYRSVVEYSHEGIVIVDARFRIVFANSVVERMSGYHAQYLVGKDFREFLTKKSLLVVSRHYRLRQKGILVPLKYPMEIICKDGSIKLCEVSSTAFKDSKGKVYTIVHLLDVTEKEMAEKRIRLLTSQIEKFSRISADILTIEDKKELFSKMCNAIVEISDFDRVLIFVFTSSPPYKEMCGYQGYSKGEIEQFLNIGFRKEDYLKIFQKGIQLGEQSSYIPRTMKYVLKNMDIEMVRTEHSEGGKLWYKEDNLFIALKNKREDIIGFVLLGVVRNEVVPTDDVIRPLEIFANHISQIIQLRRIEEERERVQKFLAQSEKMRALGEVASGVAHDFNNLLSTILGRTQLLLNKVGKSGLEEDLKIIEKAAFDGTETIRRIQNFTRLTGNDEGSPVDIRQVVEDSIIFSKGRWKDEARKVGKKIMFHTNYEGRYLVRGREGELREVFTNILFNAIDAMPEGGNVYINVRPWGRFVEVSIRDDGIGMDKETLDRVFEPFFTTKGERGSGLGLSMVYGIVKNHGGDVIIESEPGKGTNVKVRLPITDEERRQDIGEKEKYKEKPSFPVLNVLVVDDEEGPRNVLRDILSIYGMKVTIACDGKEGIEVFKRGGNISLVFTDLGMPGMSGWDLAREIKKLNSEVKVVLVTGWDVNLSSERGSVEKVVDEVVVKPFDIEKIADVIKKLF